MNSKKSAFSPEYQIGEHDKTLSSEKADACSDEVEDADSIMKDIESTYSLSKPARKIIRAKIIPE